MSLGGGRDSEALWWDRAPALARIRNALTSDAGCCELVASPLAGPCLRYDGATTQERSPP